MKRQKSEKARKREAVKQGYKKGEKGEKRRIHKRKRAIGAETERQIEGKVERRESQEEIKYIVKRTK